MGYYINALQQGKMYDLDGLRLEFSEKIGKLYYFYIHKLDELGFNYNKTDLVVSYSSKELNYIKRVQDCTTKGLLKRIGKDKVFPRY